MAGLVPFNKNKMLGTGGFEDFYNMLDDFFSDTLSSRRSLIGDTFKVDVQGTDHEYLIDAELPGIKKEEITLELNDGKLSISVNREENNEEIEDDTRNYIHRERRYSSMQRSIYLADAKNDGYSAKLENGVLKIRIPKKEKVDNTRRIEIE